MRTALNDHVRKTASLQFCLTPTCSGIYTILEGEHLSSCSTCHQTVCNECQAIHGSIHGSLSCKDYQLATLPPDRLTIILTLRCPHHRTVAILIHNIILDHSAKVVEERSNQWSSRAYTEARPGRWRFASQSFAKSYRPARMNSQNPVGPICKRPCY
jgi:hypothetical protein